MSRADERRDEIAANLEAVRGRIAAACAEAGRDPDEVTLVVVTKFFPASDVRLLADLGVTDVGENRHQEAEAKAAECADLGLALALHRRAPEQQGRRGGGATPTSSSPSTGPSWSRRLNEGAHERGRTRSTACSRSASTRPTPTGRSGADPDRPARRWPRRSRRPGCSGCAA